MSVSVAVLEKEFTEVDPLVANAIDSQYIGSKNNKLFPDINLSVSLAKLVQKHVNAIKSSRQNSTSSSPSSSQASPVRVLDIGCSVGRTTIEMSRYFDQVIGIDFSTRFIRIGKQLVEKNKLQYNVPVEGELTAFKRIQLQLLPEPTASTAANSNSGSSSSGSSPDAISNMKISASAISASIPVSIAVTASDLKKKIDFSQTDCCNIDRTKFSDFDCIVISGGLDRMYSPDQLLSNIHKYFSDKSNTVGVLVVALASHWDEAFTPKSSWIGGVKDAGESIDTSAGLDKLLLPHFHRVSNKQIYGNGDDKNDSTDQNFDYEVDLSSSSVDLYEYSRVTARTFQVNVVQVSTWVRK
jgi:SAM-dependent methyltransferase